MVNTIKYIMTTISQPNKQFYLAVKAISIYKRLL